MDKMSSLIEGVNEPRLFIRQHQMAVYHCGLISQKVMLRITSDPRDRTQIVGLPGYRGFRHIPSHRVETMESF